MHPSLDLANPKNLPLLYKRRAEQALRGTKADVLDLCRMLETMSTRNLLPFFVPVFYTILDPKGLDDCCDTLSLENIFRTLACTPGVAILLNANSFPLDVFEDLWTRVLKWAESLELLLPRVNASLKERAEHYANFSEIFYAMFRRTLNAPRISSLLPKNTGFYAVVGAAWAYAVQTGFHPYPGNSPIAQLLDFASENGMIAPVNMHALVQGAGGTWRHLAIVILKHFHFMVPSGHASLTDDIFRQITAVYSLLVLARNHFPELRAALLRRRIITALVFTCCALLKSAHRPSLAGWQQMTHSYLSLLSDYLGVARRQEHIAEALRAGLMSAFLGCHQDVWNVLEIINNTVFHSVLSEFRVCREELKRVDPEREFSKGSTSDFAGAWKLLFKHVDERLAILKLYETGSLTDLRACDNLRVRLTDSGNCSVNAPAVRCDSQKRYDAEMFAMPKGDCTTGHHREDCAFLAEKKRTLCADIGPKDPAFLRALVHKENLAAMDKLQLSRSPAPYYFTIFDFSEGYLEITLRDPSELSPAVLNEFRTEIARATRPGADRRVEMHLVVLQGRNWQAEKN
ncbi:hypothetical protein C8F01DRAFT_1087857 [Mycena amicta]|nr:hypothetical protein C8F01DRAFT_1087857 [Mycena amicta]